MTYSRRRRRRRPSLALPMLRRLLVVGAGLAFLALVGTAWFTLVAARNNAAAARQATARSVALLEAGNASAARDAALAAVRRDAGLAEAHRALARAMLFLEDGIGAEAELQHALDAGDDPRHLHHLRAHA